ncbi:hypothetical protein [Tuwongella immobilis]|uniref:DUF3352 domain-containing protein n=1 Tax=Tuwongella immobilis TaxID=692036 RepID=A0A6C2YQ62_9BACT|nr:hypothetical protein [Tuwongella immobilis]VIP03451.1 Uncharacterized protein OS=Blastopirellula marina DSM 3645 GN=DSM3645_14115 PE=4 SV=1 [Tuwongella immobilis]VTS04274.1 Uncharacterized protein OS=Blastopirellula marina DSM 3645 GN=DSM3645_14115 PE=4 SV=1 [Tuwongella immobilis]
MRMKWLAMVACVLSFGSGVRAEDSTQPTVLVKINSLDQWINKAKYFAQLADQGDQVEQFEGLIQAFKTEKGIYGIDTSRPIGFAASISENPTESPILVMLPVADEESVLGLLKQFRLEAKKNDDGTYVLSIPNVPVGVYFTFAQKYLVVTALEAGNLSAKKLPDIAKLLALRPQDAISMSLFMDRIPDSMIDLVIGQLEARVPEEPEGATEAQRKLNKKIQEYGLAGLKQLLSEGKELTGIVSVDEKTGLIGLEGSFSGRPGTKLAEAIAGAKSSVSKVAGKFVDMKASAKSMTSMALPSSLLPDLGKVVDEGLEQLLSSSTDPGLEIVAPVLKALVPTIKAGVIDSGSALTIAPGSSQATAIFAVGVKGGKNIESKIKAAVAQLPEQLQSRFKLDSGKIGSLNLHTISTEGADAEFAAMFGDGPVTLGVTDSMIVVGIGPDVKTQLGLFEKSPAKAVGLSTSSLPIDGFLEIAASQSSDPGMKARAKELKGTKLPKGDLMQATLVSDGTSLSVKFFVNGFIAKLGTTSSK